MAEKLNYSIVEDKLSSFNASCESLYNALKELDTIVSETLGENDIINDEQDEDRINYGTVRGRIGRILLNDWNNNCACFLNFKGLFDEWHDAALDICKQNYEFEQEATEATEAVYTKNESNGDGGAA